MSIEIHVKGERLEANERPPSRINVEERLARARALRAKQSPITARDIDKLKREGRYEPDDAPLSEEAWRAIKKRAPRQLGRSRGSKLTR